MYSLCRLGVGDDGGLGVGEGGGVRVVCCVVLERELHEAVQQL